MLRNKKFARYAIAFNLLGIVFNFMYSGLQNDQINIIQGFSAWTNNYTLLPLTIGNLVCIVLTFIYGTLFIRVGVKKTLIPCIFLSALGCVGIAALFPLLKLKDANAADRA
jgi:MFS transporter, OFA family, oxalate/formate antiporter